MFTHRTLRHRLSIAFRMLKNQPRGFYIDYAYPESVPAYVPTYAHLEDYLAEQKDAFKEQIGKFAEFLPAMRARIGADTIPWQNPGQFPHLDIAAAYLLLRELKPERVIEMGSGSSTFVLSAALEDNQSGRLTCIDPKPRKSIEALDVQFERRVLSADDVKLVDEFKPNDIFFIDSSHIFLAGGDVDIQFNRFFPALPKGAIVHIHDIFLPDGYPEHWHRLHYAEQNALIGWLLSGYFDIVYPGYYVATRMQAELNAVFCDLMPANPKTSAGSIWLRKR